MPFGVSGFDFRKIKDLVDETCEALRFLDDDAQESPPLRDVEIRIVVQNLRKSADRRKRRP
jgi:hypothetical protein